MRSITIIPVSFIPFDAGGWSQKSQELMQEYVNRRARLRKTTQHQKEKILVGDDTFQFLTTDESGRKYIFDIFHDGFGIATVVDEASTLPCNKLNPSHFLSERRSRHIGILEGNHQIYDIICEHISGTRATLATSLKLRRSASNSWRRNGLAYIFTVYFLEVTSDEPHDASQGPLLSVHCLDNDEALRRKLCLMLEPSILGIIDTPSFEPGTSDLAWNSRWSIAELPDSFEPLSHYWSCVSWSTGLIVGPIDQRVMDDYSFLEKRLQHAWVKVLCLSDEVEFIQDLGVGRDRQQIERLIHETRSQLSSIKHIAEPSLGSRYFNILAKLIKTSMFEQHIERLQDRLQLLDSRAQSQEARVRRRYQKVVESLLFIFAFLQAVFLVVTLDQIQNPYALVGLGVILIAGILFLLRT